MCEHEALKAVVEVRRVGARRIAEMTLQCRTCGMPFVFDGLGFGRTADGGLEALLPVRPLFEGGGEPPKGGTTYPVSGCREREAA